MSVRAPESLFVVHMRVPFCGAFVSAACETIRRSDMHVPLHYVVIGQEGNITEQGCVADTGDFESGPPGYTENDVDCVYAGFLSYCRKMHV